jgi:type III pantothenate kinase
MLMAVDIGNTKIAIGVFEAEKLHTTLSIETDVHQLADEYASLLLTLLPYHDITMEDIDEAIICSVVPPLLPVFEELFQRYLGVSPLVIGTGIKTGVRIRLDNSREVGADRVVNAAAAYRLYGGPAIVIDMGTATTFDVVSKEGDYLGGAITAGMEVAAEALFLRAAKLPRVELVRPKHAIGKNSVTAIQSGIVFGYIGLIESLVARICEELGEKARVIATGGYAELIAKETPVIEVVNPHLTLLGLRFIHDLNRR